MKRVKPASPKPSRDNSILMERLKGHVEITPEQRLKRDAEISSIFQVKEDAAAQAKLKKQQRDAEIFDLLGGKKTSISELSRYVTPNRSTYAALFPNTVDFWREIFRLNIWDDLDPTEFVKPPIVGKWLCELIYNRYKKEVLPAVRMYNPAFRNGFRRYKHFQFLTPEAKAMLVQFRDDAIEMMRSCATWIEFRQKYLAAYGIGYQTPLF